MADQKKPRETRDKAPRELDERELDQASGGTTRRSATDPNAPVTSYKPKYEDSIAGDVAQVGLGVAAN